MAIGRKEVYEMIDDQLAKNGHWVFTPYITKNGKRIYPQKARFFKFWVED